VHVARKSRAAPHYSFLYTDDLFTFLRKIKTKLMTMTLDDFDVSGAGHWPVDSGGTFGQCSVIVACVDPTPPVPMAMAQGGRYALYCELSRSAAVLEAAGICGALSDHAAPLQSRALLTAGGWRRNR